MLSVNARKYALRIQINCTPAVLIYQEICAIIPKRAQFTQRCKTAFVSVAQGIEQWFPKPCAGRSNRPRDTTTDLFELLLLSRRLRRESTDE